MTNDQSPITNFYIFWFQWVCVTLVGFLVSLLWIEVGERPDIGVLEGAIGGSAVGLAQAFVLRQQVEVSKTMPNAIAGWWVLTSVLSWGLIGGSGVGAIGWVAPRTLLFEARIIFGIFNGGLAGALLGLLQGLVLFQQAQKAWIWVLVSSVSWAMGLAMGWAVGGLLREATRLFVSEVVGLAVAWVIVAAITGVALIGLVRFKPG
ncbi:hypothetical protein [Coleofasciculus sp. FACHB-1120]|uniref:hypothetical protein n=1 Tax=Coleofasciculus sp. FACHB-1120 TaxID=2692783 RepID=UPI001688E81E|nr:hypothetical protein [Coleofasciculus sp. FACHB-1120]MBD2740123.1 hypothetical protein [Coleofasciculus sp. FACHB-1120]